MENMVGKDNTLLDAVRELEKEVERLRQVLEINEPKDTEEKVPWTTGQGAAEQKVLDTIHRLKILESRIAESAKIAGQLIKAMGA